MLQQLVRNISKWEQRRIQKTRQKQWTTVNGKFFFFFTSHLTWHLPGLRLFLCLKNTSKHYFRRRSSRWDHCPAHAGAAWIPQRCGHSAAAAAFLMCAPSTAQKGASIGLDLTVNLNAILRARRSHYASKSAPAGGNECRKYISPRKDECGFQK